MIDSTYLGIYWGAWRGVILKELFPVLISPLSDGVSPSEYGPLWYPTYIHWSKMSTYLCRVKRTNVHVIYSCTKLDGLTTVDMSVVCARGGAEVVCSRIVETCVSHPLQLSVS